MAGSINFGNNGAPFWFMQANVSTHAYTVMCLFCAFGFLHFVVIATVQAKCWSEAHTKDIRVAALFVFSIPVRIHV